MAGSLRDRSKSKLFRKLLDCPFSSGGRECSSEHRPLAYRYVLRSLQFVIDFRTVPEVRIPLPPPASLNCREILQYNPRNTRKKPAFRDIWPPNRTGENDLQQKFPLMGDFSPAPSLVVRFQEQAQANGRRSQSERRAKANLTSDSR